MIVILDHKKFDLSQTLNVSQQANCSLLIYIYIFYPVKNISYNVEKDEVECSLKTAPLTYLYFRLWQSQCKIFAIQFS